MAKRWILCFDGTWKGADEGEEASNVVQVMRAIMRYHEDDGEKTPQLLFYREGVGRLKGLSKWSVGASGEGMEEHVQSGYVFLGNNWRKGDKVYMFGFSRGAYTARMLAGFLGTVGLLDRHDLGELGALWNLYDKKMGKPSPEDLERFKKDRDVGLQEVDIEFLGVWDTVGTRGVPLLSKYLFRQGRFMFHHDHLGKRVKAARQALAVDERRRPFRPALWRRPPKGEEWVDKTAAGKPRVKQAWFPGYHTDVGGGHEAHALSRVTLHWMLEELGETTDLRLDGKKLAKILKEGEGPYQLHDSMTPWYRLAGSKRREILKERKASWRRRLPWHKAEQPTVGESVHETTRTLLGQKVSVQYKWVPTRTFTRKRRYTPKNLPPRGDGAASGSKDDTPAPAS